MPRNLAWIAAIVLAPCAALAEPGNPPSSDSALQPPDPTVEPARTPTPTAVPSSPEPTPAKPSPTPVPAPVASAPSAAALPAPSAGTARIRLAIDYPNAWLETRHFGETGAWQRGCAAPCGQLLPVDGVELRVNAPDMTPSKPFRVEPGSGAALLKVDGGSASARAWGRASFAVGVPVALLGMTGFALGSFDDRDGLRTAGAVSLGVGAALILVALPLLVHGATDVKNEKGDSVALRKPSEAL